MQPLMELVNSENDIFVKDEDWRIEFDEKKHKISSKNSNQRQVIQICIKPFFILFYLYYVDHNLMNKAKHNLSLVFEL